MVEIPRQGTGTFSQKTQNRFSSKEANPFMEPMTYTAEHGRMHKYTHAIGHIEVPCYRGGVHESDDNETGTGWLIAPGLFITCWHVVAILSDSEDSPPEASDLYLQWRNILISFDYTEIGNKVQYSVDKLEYPLDGIQPCQDFAILRLHDRLEDYPYSRRGYLPVAPNSPLSTLTKLRVIQHPFGQPQQYADGHYMSCSEGRIFYTTPTDQGTSGAPVLNRADWRVVALHSGENDLMGFREGVTMKSILSELQKISPDIYSEIMSAQQEDSSDLYNQISPAQHILNSASKTASRRSYEVSSQQEQRPKPRLPLYGEGKFQKSPVEFDTLLSELLSRVGGVPRIAIVGLGGKGKTRLAHEIARYLKDQGTFPDKIFWMVPEEANKLPLSSEDKLKRQAWEADFARLAVESEYLPTNNDKHASENQTLRTERARYICDYLARCEGALIVFDNVEDPQYAIQVISIITGEPTRCAILYTSQYREEPFVYSGERIYRHEIEKLSDESACNLLLEKRPELLKSIKSNKNSIEGDAIRTILSAVENLPLTLLLLCSLLGDDKYRYASLCPLAEELKMLGQVGTLDPAIRARDALRRIFTLRWERIENEDARRLVQLMAYYPTISAIPLDLLSIAMGKKEESPLDIRSFHQAKVDLHNWSLVETFSGNEVRLHSFICEMIRKYVESDGNAGKALRKEAVNHLLDAFAKLNNLTKHAQQLGYWQCLDRLKAVSQYAWSLDESEAKTLSRLAHWLQYEGNLLGNGDFWPELLPELLYQQLYNHFIDEDGSCELKDAPKHWIRLAKSVGEKSSLSLWTQNFHSDSDIKGFVFSPDNKQVALAFYDPLEDKTSITLYNRVTGHPFYITVPNPISVMDIIFTPDSKRLIAGDALGRILVWDVTDGELLDDYNWESGETFTCVAFSPDATVIAAGTKRGLVDFYNLENKKETGPLLCSTSLTPLEEVTFSHNGVLIAVRAADCVSIWDYSSEICLYKHKQAVTCLAFSPDDQWLALGNNDRSVSLQNPLSQISQTILSKDTNDLICLAFSTDGTKLIVGQKNVATRIWNIEHINRGSVDLLAELPDRREYITHVAFSSDNTCMITAGKAGKVHARDYTEIIQSQQWGEQVGKVENLVFSSSGATLLTLASNREIQQWNRDGTRISELWHNVTDQTEHVISLASYQLGKRFSIGTSLGYIWLYDTEQPEKQIKLGQHEGYVTCQAFSPDGSILATGSNNGTIHLYDVTINQQIRMLVGQKTSISCLAFAPDNAHLIASSSDGMFSFWNIATGTCSKPLPRQALIIDHMCILSDGETLVAGTNDGRVHAWVKTGSGDFESLCFSSPMSSEITALTCAPVGKILIICYSNHQTDFVQLVETPVKKLQLIGKVTTASPVSAIHWSDHTTLTLAGVDEATGYPRIYSFVLEGHSLL